MISDTLDAAALEIREYLKLGAYGEPGSARRQRFELLAEVMEAIRSELDRPDEAGASRAAPAKVIEFRIFRDEFVGERGPWSLVDVEVRATGGAA